MSEDESNVTEDWPRVRHEVRVAVLTIVVISMGSIVVAALQGHARKIDVEDYQDSNDIRVYILEKQLAAHITLFEDERKDQAFFRGAVAAKLGFILIQDVEEHSN